MTALHCRLLLIRRTVLTPGWIADLTAPWWRLYRHDAAGVRLQCGRWILSPRSGGLVLVPPGCDAKASCDGTVRQLYVHFAPVGLDPDRVRDLLPRPLALAPLAWRDEEAAALADAPDLSTRGDLQLRVLALVHHALAEALGGLPQAMRDAGAAPIDDPFVALVQRRVEQRLDQPLSVAALAREAGLGERALRARFRTATRRSPAAWIRWRRAMAAAERLALGDESIETVAAGCGFADRYHFTRVFTQVLGMPPGRFRERHRPRSVAINGRSN